MREDIFIRLFLDSPFPKAIVNEQGIVTETNQSFKNVLPSFQLQSNFWEQLLPAIETIDHPISELSWDLKAQDVQFTACINCPNDGTQKFLQCFTRKYPNLGFLVLHINDITTTETLKQETDNHLQRLNSLLDTASLYILRIDTNGILLYANASFIQRFDAKLPVERLHFGNFIFEKEDHQVISDILDTTVQHRTPLMLRLNNPSSEQPVYTEWEVKHIQQANNIEIQLIGRDVSETAYVKAMLVDTRLQLSSILDNLNQGLYVWTVDKNFQLRFFNKNLYNDTLAAFGTTLEEGTDMTSITNMPAALQQFYTESYQEVATTLTTVSKQLNFGEFLYVTQFAPILVHQQLKGIAAIAINITEQYQKQLHLEKTQEALLEAQMLGKVGSWEFNFVTTELIWSKGMYVIHELDNNQLITPELRQSFIHPDDIALFNEQFSYYLSIRKDFEYEHRIVTASQNVKWLQSIIRFKFENGKPLKCYGLIRDITEEKTKELHILSYVKRLREYSFSISHELRRPLTNALGLIDVHNNYSASDTDKLWALEQIKTSLAEIDSITKKITDQLSPNEK
ncbi:MAG TPA: hypothetical protein DCQ29_07820 [Chitinophagaceae bacterium]|nr:hypothetical protein [Chitinophagaceae bacterium]